MPAMPRLQGKMRKPTKIAFNIMGVPANFQEKKSKIQKRVNRRLVFEETQRVR